jgi:hypothetical protein
VTDRTNADFLQVLLCEAREDPLVYLVVAERSLVSFEAQAPQPNHDIHGGAPTLPAHMIVEVKHPVQRPALKMSWIGQKRR